MPDFSEMRLIWVRLRRGLLYKFTYLNLFQNNGHFLQLNYYDKGFLLKKSYVALALYNLHFILKVILLPLPGLSSLSTSLISPCHWYRWSFSRCFLILKHYYGLHMFASYLRDHDVRKKLLQLIPNFNHSFHYLALRVLLKWLSLSC